MFGWKIHFVEVRVEEMEFCTAGIGNADPVLADLQRFCKRLLILVVEMLILFWGFQLDLLGMVLFLMAIQGTPHNIKGFPGFGLVIEKHVCMCCISF